MENNYKYDVFISYRHLEPDAAIAGSLHRLLEEYRVPGELKNRMRWRQRSFIDREELATKDLSESIIDALKNSYALIAVCSRQTKDSPWCEKEIELFRRFHGDDRIFVLLIEGEPEESFLAPLKQLKKEGDSEGIREDYKEILAADVRSQRVKDRRFPGYRGMDRATLAPYRKDSLEILRHSEIHRIMAGIYGVSYGDMRQRQKERRFKLLFALASSISFALAVFGISIFGLYQKAVESERMARQQTALMTLDYADNALRDGNRTLAVLIADKAMEEADERMSRIEYIEALNYSLLNRSLIYEPYTPVSRIQTGRESPFFLLTPDSRRLVSIGDRKNLQVWKLSNGELLMDVTAPANISSIAGEKAGEGIYAALYDGEILRFNLEDGSWASFGRAPEYFYGELAASEGGDYLVGLVNGLGTLRMDVWSLAEKGIVYSREFSEEDAFSYATVNPQKHRIAYATKKGRVVEIDLETGTEQTLFQFEGEDLTAYSFSKTIDYSDDGNYLYHIKDDTLYRFLSGGGRKEEAFVLEDTGRRMDVVGNRLYVVLQASNIFSMAIYDLDTMKRFRYVERGDSLINTFSVKKDGGDLAVSWTNGDISIWKERGMTETEDENYKVLSFIENSEAGAVRFTVDGRYLAVSALDGTISVIDTAGNESYGELEGGAVAQSASFRYILLRSHSKLSRYDTLEERVTPMTTVQEDVGDFFSIFSIGDEGEQIALASLLESTVYLYDHREPSKRLVLPYMGESPGGLITVNDMLYTKGDGSILVLYSNGEILDFSTEDGSLLRRFPPRKVEVTSLVIDPQKELLALNQGDGQAVVMALETGEEVITLEGEIYSVDGGIREEGGIRATGIVNDEVFHWQDGALSITTTNNLRQSVRSKSLHTNTISPDGRFLITALSGDIIVLTDARTGVFLKSFQSRKQYYQKVFFNYNSDQIIYKGGETVTKIEGLPAKEDLLVRAQELLEGRQMSQEELEKIGKSR